MKLSGISTLVLGACIIAAPLSTATIAGPPSLPKTLLVIVGPAAAEAVLLKTLWTPLEGALKRGLVRTQDESITIVVLDGVTAESKLIIAEQKLHTKNTQFRARWYGSITVKTEVTSLASCTVKLNELHLKWNAVRNTVLVVLPKIVVDSVQDVAWKEKISYTGIGDVFYRDTRSDLTARARSEVASETRSEAQKQIARIRADCVKALQSALEDKLKTIAPDVHVRVE